MKKGQITCSACSHVFAVPANARAAICPRCGQALPVFVGSIEPTEVPPPRPKPPVKHALSSTPSAQLGRIKLKRKSTAPPPTPPPPPVPPPVPPTYSTVPDQTGIQKDLPPLPDAVPHGLPVDTSGEAQFIPIETEEYAVDDDRETETYDQMGLDSSTEQTSQPPWAAGPAATPDLPASPGAALEAGYFEAPGDGYAEEGYPDEGYADEGYADEGYPEEYADETDIPARTGVDLPPAPSSGEYRPPGRAPTLPWGSEQLNTDTVPGGDVDPLASVPTLTREQGAIVPPPPMDLPPPGRGAIVPPPPMNLPPPGPGAIVPPPPTDRPSPPGGPDLPPPPGFADLGASGFDGLPPPPTQPPDEVPLPPPPGPGGRKHSPSQRVKALDRAISEVIETGDEPTGAWGDPPAPPARAPTKALEQRPPPTPMPRSSPPPPPSPDAPVSLGHSGIMVAIPDRPIEEVVSGDERPAAPAPRLRPVRPATNELAPISRPPPKVHAGVGSALKEQKPTKRAPPSWLMYALIGGIGLAVLTVLIIVLATRLGSG